MTHQHRFQPSNLSKSALFGGILMLFCLGLLLRNPTVAATALRRGLSACADSVIPALFPFMVISEITVRTGIGRLLVHRIAPLLRPILQLSDSGCYAVLAGMLCGFPIGIRIAVSEWREGRMRQEEVARVLFFSGNASSAFVVRAVGGALWESVALGRVLFLLLLLTQLAVGIFFSRLSPTKKEDLSDPPDSNTQSTPVLTAITASIRDSALAMLTVCAYVVFFSALTAALGAALQATDRSGYLPALASGLLEVTNGVMCAAALPSAKWGLALTAFSVGWGGCSVHLQALSLCDGIRYDRRRYLLAKMMQGILCALLLSLTVAAVPSLLRPSAPVFKVTSNSSLPLVTVLFLLLVLLLPFRGASARSQPLHTVVPPRRDSTAAYPPERPAPPHSPNTPAE